MEDNWSLIMRNEVINWIHWSVADKSLKAVARNSSGDQLVALWTNFPSLTTKLLEFLNLMLESLHLSISFFLSPPSDKSLRYGWWMNESTNEIIFNQVNSLLKIDFGHISGQLCDVIIDLNSKPNP